MKPLGTRRSGFIGSAVVRLLVKCGKRVMNLDSFAYATNPANLAPGADNPRYTFVHVYIRE